jgi:hypothetical protein
MLLLVLTLLLPGAVPTQAAPTVSAAPFAEYYWQHHGHRVLGAINSELLDIDGIPMQYFEKARLEDHGGAVAYGRLTSELMAQAPWLPVDGLPLTYGDLRTRGQQMHPAPAGFAGGTQVVEQGVFVPLSANLEAAPGYVVPFQLWTYINRQSFFPGGWQNDVGLPLTNAFHLDVPRGDGSTTLIVQAFERTVLTLDLTNIYGWSVERVNVGTDMLWAQGAAPLAASHAPTPADQPTGPKRIEVSLAQQWLRAYEGERLVLDMPVSTGKDGFETPPGSFAIYSKYVQKTLRGSYGGESWNVPDVPYVMFYRGGFAIHGVYWHDRFGTGERHSHGCVGVAPADAEALFGWADYGTPVLVHAD